MESEHINNRRISEVVAEDAVLAQSEIKHLQQCEECLELVRILVRQKLSKPVNVPESS
ncbi:MAG TPA: hypothetical protein VER98_13170 [Terriglobia bacterium]|nr:hypothetical protein [Terriglobia bacterium]